MLIRFVTTSRTIGRIFGDTLGRFRKKGTTINWNSPADTKKMSAQGTDLSVNRTEARKDRN